MAVSWPRVCASPGGVKSRVRRKALRQTSPAWLSVFGRTTTPSSWREVYPLRSKDGDRKGLNHCRRYRPRSLGIAVHLASGSTNANDVYRHARNSDKYLFSEILLARSGCLHRRSSGIRVETDRRALCCDGRPECWLSVVASL